MVVYWDYQSTVCHPTQADGILNETSNGAELVDSSATSDFALLRLDPATFNGGAGRSFAGWKAENYSQIGAMVGIHHPDVVEKAISIDDGPPRLMTDLVRVRNWEKGTTEP